MENSKAELLGVDESLSGNEKNIVSCLPVIRIDQSGIGSVRKLGWQEETREGVTIFANEDEARSAVTLLSGLEKTMQVYNNEVVMLVGPEFVASVNSIVGDSRFLADYFYHGLVGIQSGFQIKCVEVNTYNLICSGLVFISLGFFDSEIKKGCFTPNQVNDALKVIEGVGNVNPGKEYWVRKLLCLRTIMFNEDAYREYLEFSKQELGKSEKEIGLLVKEYIESLAVKEIGLSIKEYIESLRC